MGQILHGMSKTTIAIRKAIQESKESIQTLANRYNINHQTVIKWRKRDTVLDQKPGPKSKSTIFTTEEEAIIVAFRKHTQLGLDDCLYSLLETIPNLTRSSLHRCFQRHGISRLPHLEKQKKKTKKFKKYEPGYVHIDISQVYTEEGKLYLFVGIDRTTKYCFAKLYKDQTSKTATNFLGELIEKMPYKMDKILTDNGKQFVYKSSTYTKINNNNNNNNNNKMSSFTKLCHANKIEHRQTLAYHPWTNGQVERINRTIKEATVNKYYYYNQEKLQNHLNMFLNAYNYAKPLKTLNGLTPYEKCLLYLKTQRDKSAINPIHKTLEPNSYKEILL